jgi:uroporphyrinogen-III decarboxylase
LSYADGMAALNLEFSDRVPRTEYSADTHWPLVKAVTGLNADQNSSPEIQRQASLEFMKRWNYDFCWSILTHNQIFGEKYTRMGHAVYAAGGVDYNNQVWQAFSSVEEILNLDMEAVYGVPDQAKLIKEYNDHYDSQKDLAPYMVTMTGIYVTCISGLIELFGWEMLLEALGTDPEGFGRVADRYCRWMQSYFTALAQSKAPVVMIHDDIVWTEGPFVHPDWYRKYVFPNYQKMFAPLREAGKKILYTSDGTYTAFVDDIAPLVDGFVMEPTTDMEYIANRYGKTHVFVGNGDTRILLSGSKEEIYQEVKRCMDIGKQYPGFFMAIGNHIPANTPVENALWYEECYEKLSRR